MSESGQRQKVVKLMKPYHAIAVENPILPGTPDVNYEGGWLELKWLRAWPKRATTPVRIDHMTIQQQRWLKARWKVGGRAHLLIQCRRDWLLFNAPSYEAVRNGLTKEALFNEAAHVSTTGLTLEKLEEWLGLYSSIRNV